ncbi:hypothetical protein [Labrys monachus]|uniref:Uncharacterized protein n=1 Tax=Labrys monachus TaxID=217067 RepID=A0ABU0FKR6_9HYPH|nr:hypothetical protein [Labrys monachus]MDQ0395203.1 hypothetical protein [Labrys monachus]
MLFTGFIASLIMRLYTHQAHRHGERQWPSLRRRDDEDGGEQRRAL